MLYVKKVGYVILMSSSIIRIKLYLVNDVFRIRLDCDKHILRAPSYDVIRVILKIGDFIVPCNTQSTRAGSSHFFFFFFSELVEWQGPLTC